MLQRSMALGLLAAVAVLLLIANRPNKCRVFVTHEQQSVSPLRAESFQ